MNIGVCVCVCVCVCLCVYVCVCACIGVCVKNQMIGVLVKRVTWEFLVHMTLGVIKHEKLISISILITGHAKNV